MTAKDLSGCAALLIAFSASALPTLCFAQADAGGQPPPPDAVPSSSTLPSATPPVQDAGSDESLRAFFVEQNCDKALVICLDTKGQSFGSDTPPSTLRSGDAVVVLVVAEANSTVEAVLTTSERRFADRLFEPPRGAPAGAQIPIHFKLIKSMSFEVSADALNVTLSLATRSDPTKPLVPTAKLELPVDRGRYYMRPGVLFPAMFAATSRIYETTIPGTSDRVVRESREVAFTPALALNVYPFGRPIGHIKSHLCEWDWFLLQVGAGLNFSKPTGFAGIGIEFVSGFSLTGGLALRFDAETLDAGYEDGMLLLNGDRVRTHMGTIGAGYLGITLSSEVLETLRSLKSTIGGT